MSGPDWYRWYPSKYAHGVIGLTPEQRGVYMDIINIILDRGSCPEDYRYLAKACNCRIDRLRRLISELVDKDKLLIGQSEIVQKRAKNERRMAEEFTKIGHSLAVSRWSNRENTKDLGDAGTQCQPQPHKNKKDSVGTSPEQQTEQIRPNGRDSPAKPNLSAEFDSWWALWTIRGTKRARGRAEKAYRAARKRASAEQLAEGFIRDRKRWEAERTDPHYIPYPASWLNDRRWEDDLLAATNKPSPSPWSTL